MRQLHSTQERARRALMDDVTIEGVRQLQSSQERARLRQMEDDRRASARALRTAQERERIRRMSFDEHNIFRYRNERNQRNYRHNQGVVDNCALEYAEYMTNFDSDSKLPLEEHTFVISQQQKFRDEIAK